jgi:hypothetical protein
MKSGSLNILELSGLPRDCFTFIIRGALIFAKSWSHLESLGTEASSILRTDKYQASPYNLTPRIRAPLSQICAMFARYRKETVPIT